MPSHNPPNHALGGTPALEVAGLTRRFGSRTAVRGGSGAGFAAGDVSVEREYSGRIQFEVSPSKVQPGDAYSIKIYLTNDGKKPYKIAGLSLSTSTNGQKAPQSATPPSAELKKGNRVQVGALSGAWPSGVDKWYAEVTVTTDKKVTFRSRVTWK